MQTSEALKIIQALVDGIDPTTGEVFAGDSPYQHPQVLRALFAAAKALERQGQNERRPRSLPENAGRAWDAEEEKQLCQDFDAGMNIAVLAQKHRRTQGSIRARLERLGKISFGGTETQG